MKTEEEIKKGLECCSSGNGCPYETVKDCPYRITNASCDRAGLMADALGMISGLEEEISEKDDIINSQIDKMHDAAKALGYDCDECDRW